MDKALISEMRRKANTLKPSVQIGKQGITENMIGEIKKHLKKQKLIKIKLLKYFVDSMEGESNSENVGKVADEICQKTGAVLIQIVGFTITIYGQGKSD